MNIRKPADYSTMYAGLDRLLANELPQMELNLEIGKLISARPEKGAAVAAAEYLTANYPKRMGFSPRNLRRMRDFFRIYESNADVLKAALLIGWTQNVVILEAELTTEQRCWYIQAVCQFGWSKVELLRQIKEVAHEQIDLDLNDVSCYTGNNQEEQEYEYDQDSVCWSLECVQEPNGRVCDERSGEKSWARESVLYCLLRYQPREAWKSDLSTGTAGIGRTWDQLRWASCPTASEQRLRKVRPAHWNGQYRHPQYVPYLWRRFCRQNPLADGLYRPPGARGGQPAVHRRFRDYLEGCVGWVPEFVPKNYYQRCRCEDRLITGLESTVSKNPIIL